WRHDRGASVSRSARFPHLRWPDRGSQVVAGSQDQKRSIAEAVALSTEADFSGTTAVREQHRFDETRLAQWLAEHVPGYQGPLQVEQFKGGQSNPTYRLVTPTKMYVMRRKPPGPLLKGAHAVEREARVLQALERVNFPVAHVH